MSLNEAKVKGFRPIEELLPSYWRANTVVANGIQHHLYRTGGDGPPVLLLHGFLEGALAWIPTALALETDYDVIMLDARGHGHSGRVGERYSQELLNDDVVGVIRALRLGKPHIVGFSQGGMTGIHVAAAHPDLVNSLVVAGWGEPAGPDPSQSAGYRAWFGNFVSWLESLKAQTHSQRMVSALRQYPPGGLNLDEEEYVAWVENTSHLDVDMVKHSMNLWSDVGQRTEAALGAMKKLNCPVLVMRSSFFPKPEATPYLVEEPSDHANIRIVRFENAGHMIYRDHFEEFISLVKGFLDRA